MCLYSEDRKFFLHGELYCALASAIGEGGKSFRELVRELEQDFPSDKIHEALKRLVDRRYVLPASRSSAGAVAAYWASLGLSPETAERNLQKCRVRIQSIDVQGATELGAALSELGVRVVKRSPDLTVTLVSDYLEGRLAELNRQHLSDRTPWLLVQPSGIFPLVGPVFSPGKSACWTCLADRMKRNREIKALLDRRQARCVAVSPLARHTLGQSAHPACSRRDRESDRHRLSHGIARSHHQPRPVGLDHREALRGGPPAMSELRPQEAARPEPCAGAGRARRRRQAGHDERRVPDRFAEGHGCTFPQAREPAHRRGLASRTDRSRPALEHQLLCHAQFFGARQDGQRAQGRTERRQLRQGQHRRAGRSQRAHGGDRALFRDFSGRRDQSDTAVHGFPVRRCHSSE